MRKKLSITWKVYFYLIAFTGILLFLIWYMQIAKLDSFYQKIKRSELKSAAKKMVSVLEDDNLTKNMMTIADEYDIGINIVNSDGKSVVNANLMNSSLIYILDKKQYEDYYNKASENGGEILFEIEGRFREMGEGFTPQLPMNYDKGEMTLEKPSEDIVSESQPEFDNEKKEWFNEKKNSSQSSKSMIYAKIITNDEGEEQLLLMCALITPVDATVSTLQKQFMYIAIVYVVLAIAIALFISKIVAKPIVKMSASAKKLAGGNFDVVFEGGSYKEVDELSTTLNYAAEELQRTETLRKELIANVSHDLRTPLTMITAYAEVMRDIPGENSPENIQIIIDEAQRLTTLVNDMLDLSKLQAGALEFKPEEFDFTTNILAVLKRFSKLKEQDGYDISFVYDNNVKVVADEYKIYQVVYNLINNAINYAGDDKVIIVRQIEKDNAVRLEVEDHGEGISEEEVKNIWDRYYKVDKVHKRAVQGTGLGLSIVYNILKLHDADFGVESKKGEGSIFWFEINK